MAWGGDNGQQDVTILNVVFKPVLWLFNKAFDVLAVGYEKLLKISLKARVLVIGVGCQIQALRAVEKKLGLDKLYVLGTPCVDNVTRAGLQKSLDTTNNSPETVVHYEFMQDFRVHFKHEDGSTETVPFFGFTLRF